MPRSTHEEALSNLRLRTLQAFDAVVQHQEFRVAGESLDLTAESIRTQVHKLRDIVGVDVLQQHPGDRGKWIPTEVGREVHKAAREILDRAERLRTRRGAPVVAFLPHHAPILAGVCSAVAKEGRDQLKHIGLRVLGESERSRESFRTNVLTRLAGGAFDVVIGPEPEDAGLESRTLYEPAYRALVPKASRLSVLSIADLADRRLLVPPASTRTRAVLDAAMEQSRVPANIVLEAYQTKVLVLMGWAGLGTVVLPADLARPYGLGGEFAGPYAEAHQWVDVVDSDGKALSHPVCVTHRQDARSEVKDVVVRIQHAVHDLGYLTLERKG